MISVVEGDVVGVAGMAEEEVAVGKPKVEDISVLAPIIENAGKLLGSVLALLEPANVWQVSTANSKKSISHSQDKGLLVADARYVT